ncbi:MAG: hypothetical protein ACT4QG_22555 [Sporichthyaceae bacterium]
MFVQPLTRRTVLAGGLALAALAGCSDGSPPPSGQAPDVTPNDPDRPTLDTVRAEKAALIAEYDTALAARPELAKDLAPLRAAHSAHLVALGGQTPVDASPSPSPAVPEGRDAVLKRLASAEKSAAAKRIEQCAGLRSGELARLLAAIGAAEAAHESVVRGLTGGAA